jgi:hypothetical protein
MEGTQVDYTNYLYKGSIDLMPKYVGCYQLGGEFGLRIMFRKKPNWFHRTMMIYSDDYVALKMTTS